MYFMYIVHVYLVYHHLEHVFIKQFNTIGQVSMKVTDHDQFNPSPVNLCSYSLQPQLLEWKPPQPTDNLRKKTLYNP